MKRLVLLTILLTPVAIHSIRDMDFGGRPQDAPSFESILAAPLIDDLPEPPAPPAPPIAPLAPASPAEAFAVSERREPEMIFGDPMATEDRAAEEGRRQLARRLSDWLGEVGVARDWRPPAHLVRAIVVSEQLRPEHREYGDLFVPVLEVDLSRSQRELFLEAYDHEVAGRRLVLLGVVIAFILIVLAAVSGYIRADEATKGYYTNRLRLLAAAGVGVAGIAAYRFLG